MNDRPLSEAEIAALEVVSWAPQLVRPGVVKPALLSSGTWTYQGGSGFTTAGATNTVHTARWNVAVIRPGTYNLAMNFTKASSSGIVNLDYSIDGGTNWRSLAAAVDLYSAAAAVGITQADIVFVRPCRLMVRVTGTGTKNASSTAYYWLASDIALTRIA